MALALSTFTHEPMAPTSPRTQASIRSLGKRLRDTTLVTFEPLPEASLAKDFFEVFHDPTDDESTDPPSDMPETINFEPADKFAKDIFYSSENDENQENVPPAEIPFYQSSPPRSKNAGISVLGELCIESLALGLRVAASTPQEEHVPKKSKSSSSIVSSSSSSSSSSRSPRRRLFAIKPLATREKSPSKRVRL